MDNDPSPIQFIKSADSFEGEADLASYLAINLSTGEKVLWVVTGGSNIAISVKVMSELDASLTTNLRIILCDERYGKASHKDSNYNQLIAAGFDKKQATFEPLLDDSLDAQQTTNKFAELLTTDLAWADVSIAQLGIGDDGHIAGILPNSPVIDSTESVVYYKSDPFERISLSLEALKQFSQILVFCFGTNKLNALERLHAANEGVQTLPSAILRQIANVKLYNDQLGE